LAETVVTEHPQNRYMMISVTLGLGIYTQETDTHIFLSVQPKLCND